MIAGFRRSRVIWLEPLVELLAGRRQVILMDNRGTGDSGKPQEGYSIDAFADDCAGVLKQLGFARAHVFGVSMGGMIAQRLAVRHGGSVQGLVIGCSHCGNSRAVPAERRIWELLRLTPGEGLSPREVARRQEEAYFTPSFRAANRPLLDRLFELVSANPTPPHAVRGHLAAIEAWEGCADLGRIKAPTLVIAGEADPLIPAENSRIIANGIPGAQLRMLAGASHFFWVEQPQATANALNDFLSHVP
jgi:pimeloyl-ACP methyl ester carboxylesterase